MLASLITGAVAIFSGLAFIAYKHPIGYRRIHLPLIASIWALWIIRMIYIAGESSGFYHALSGVRELNKDKIFQTPSFDMDPMWWFLIPLGVVLYLSCLRALPSILELPDRDR
jgi:hypothetical protein